MAAGDAGEALETHVAAVDLVLTAGELLGGRAGKLTTGLVHIGEQRDVDGGVPMPARVVPGASCGGRGCFPVDRLAALQEGVELLP